jgi:hypothetical protein
MPGNTHVNSCNAGPLSLPPPAEYDGGQPETDAIPVPAVLARFCPNNEPRSANRVGAAGVCRQPSIDGFFVRRFVLGENFRVDGFAVEVGEQGA